MTGAWEPSSPASGAEALGRVGKAGRVQSEWESEVAPEEASDSLWMTRALALAAEAAALGEVPVGALVVDGSGRLLSQAYNLRETTEDPTAHAERIALTLAGRARGSWRLDDCTLYVTLEPCAMCAGALVLARIARLVYGCDDPKAGACRSLYSIPGDPRLNHRIPITPGVLHEDAAAQLRAFFRARRRSKL